MPKYRWVYRDLKPEDFKLVEVERFRKKVKELVLDKRYLRQTGKYVREEIMGIFDGVDDTMLRECIEVIPYETAKGMKYEVKVDKKRLKLLKELTNYKPRKMTMVCL